MALHCNAPGDIEIIVPSPARWRIDEHKLFRSGLTKQWLAGASIPTIGYRLIRDEFRAAPKQKHT